MNIEYAALHGRSIFKPIVEMWNFNLKQFDFMTALLNSKVNKDLF